MYKFCVFAGTTEGRELVSFLAEQAVSVTACVATEYGQTLLESAENLTVSAKRLTEEEMRAMLEENRFDLVLDATHPYAQAVTENICRACEESGTPYLRVLREASQVAEEEIFVPDIAGAVEYLNTTEGPILLTTGSKELAKFTALRDFKDRVYARVLPMESSLAACREAGVQPARILAMQGPFTEDMNIAMLRFSGAQYLVTKDGGSAGGFAEKAAAAKAVGARLVVIGRPAQHVGRPLPEALALLCRDFGCRRIPRVTIVGIGPGSNAGMTEEVRRAIGDADCVIGAERMLQTAQGKPCFAAIAPEAISQLIHSHQEFRRFAVVMSGDTGFFSGTKKLLPLLDDCKTEVLPGISSLSCLCARLGKSYDDAKVVSLHGRSGDIVRDVRGEKKVFALVGGDRGMNSLCESLTEAGLAAVRVSVGERLGYPDEKITVSTARELCSESFSPLCVALIENDTPDAAVTHGLPDAVFHRGESADGVVPMTKQEVRAVSLSKLALTKHALCWDIGAGTGSVAIEMALQCPGGHVYAIERKAEAAALLEENRARLHADNLTAITGTAPEACDSLPAPTHVFIGGSAGNMRQILTMILQKNPHARIVATAIALETVAELTDCLKAFPFTETDVVCLQVARDRKAGPYHLMTGSNPVYIFTMQAGGTEV